MTIQKILLTENKRSIQCYRKGVFWTAYEQSAYRIYQLRPYKPNLRYIKYIEKHIVSVGFPQNAMEKLLADLSEKYQLEINEVYIKISGDDFLDTEDFENWKENLITDTDDNKSLPDLNELLLSFPLENKTPIDAYGFLHTLQCCIRKTKCTAVQCCKNI